MKVPQKNWLEWSVFALGFSLVAATLGVLVFGAFSLPDTPPAIAVKIGEIRKQKSHFAVSVTARNSGGQTAEGVRIEVTLQPRGATKSEEETGDFEIAYLPHNAKRTGWVTFESDPKNGALKARVAGYEEP